MSHSASRPLAARLPALLPIRLSALTKGNNEQNRWRRCCRCRDRTHWPGNNPRSNFATNQRKNLKVSNLPRPLVARGSIPNVSLTPSVASAVFFRCRRCPRERRPARRRDASYYRIRWTLIGVNISLENITKTDIFLLSPKNGSDDISARRK